MNKPYLVVFVLFIVAITPSFSELIEARETQSQSFTLLLVWYLFLLLILWHTWKVLV